VRALLNIHPDNVLDARDVNISVVVTNDGPDPALLNRSFLEMPAITLEIRDRDGNRVPLGPPPVPPTEDQQTWDELAPGKALELRYTGGELFGVSPPPGRYSIRFVDPTPRSETQPAFQSDWVSFTVSWSSR
jgi:hypothetical protein